MKKFILTVTVLIAFLLNLAATDNVANKSANITSRVRIITPITLVNTNSQALDFGVIARGTTDATIVVAPQDAPGVNVATGNAVILSSSPQTAAMFTVSGESSSTFSITIPTASVALSDGQSHTLSISAFTCSIESRIGTIGSSDVFYVGGTLYVPAAAFAASYSGTFNVNVAYN
jgi:hypothetical protein